MVLGAWESYLSFLGWPGLNAKPFGAEFSVFGNISILNGLFYGGTFF
jgi:hypothetical protein